MFLRIFLSWFRKPLVWRGILPFCVLLLQFRVVAGDYLIDSWDSEKGLPGDFVTAITQTPEGNLWVGTYNGLARFDGLHFTVFTPENTPELGHARIVKLFRDARGTLWINTYDGSLVSWRNGVFTREWDGRKKGMSEAWPVASNPYEIIISFRNGLLLRRSLTAGKDEWHTIMPPGSPPGAFYCMDQQGTLWCSTLDGNLLRVVGDNFQPVPKDCGLGGGIVHWLTSDSSGRIWVGTDKEMDIWDGVRFQNMTPVQETNLNVAFLSFLKDGSALVAANGKLRKYRDGKWVRDLKAWPDVMQEQQLQFSVSEDREGGIWRVSRGLGLFHISSNGLTEQLTVTNGLPGDHTMCCFEDREGNIWVGLGNNGLARLRKKYFTVVNTGEQQNRPAMSVCEDGKGTLWIGTYGGGLNSLQDGKLTHYEISAQTPGDFVFSICPTRQDGLWISGGMEDSFLFKDGAVKRAPVFVHGIKCIFEDQQGRIWIGRKDGVDRWTNGKLREWSSHTGSVAKPVRAIAQDLSGNIWIGGDDGNIYRVDGDELRSVALPKYPAHQAVWSILADTDNSLWIGTSDAGLLHFEKDHFSRFTAADGLPDNLIGQILDDGRGNLWLGTHRGICRASKKALHDFAEHKTFAIQCTTYGKSDGLPSLQCATMYQPEAWKGRDGRLWFATAKGVVAVQPSEITLNTDSPPVQIEEVLVDGKARARGGMQPNRIEVAPGTQTFEFYYTALSLVDAEKVQFQYKLEGVDADWIGAGVRRWVQYNHLKPGSYHFCVRACNNDGVWNETGASLDMRILPHVWQAWWFKLSLALTLTGVIAAAIRYASQRELRAEMQRLAHQRDLEHERTRIARDIHDHLGSGLTRINLLNELLLGEPPEQLGARVKQITTVTCQLMQEMDEIVWAVNPKNDSLESLISYLCDFADEFLRAANIRFRIHLPAPLPTGRLTPEVRHNLFLAVKEILNNIVKHSKASEVSFELQLDEAGAVLEIRDNGCGFLTHKTFSGNGLGNLAKRATDFGGLCRILSEPGSGTQIQLIVPASNLRKN